MLKTLPRRIKNGEILGDYTAVYDGNEYKGKLEYKEPDKISVSK